MSDYSLHKLIQKAQESASTNESKQFGVVGGIVTNAVDPDNLGRVDVKNKKVVNEAKEGDVEIRAEKKIVLDCEDLEIKTKKSGKMEIGTTFDLKVSSNCNIKAGSQLNLKASRVNIN